MVEQNRSGVCTQIVYGPLGNKLALMNGQTLSKGFVGLPGGATAVYTWNNSSAVLSYYRHADWLGSSRLDSSSSQAVIYQVAYGPYGEPYDESGTTDRNFTGQNQDTVGDMYDFLYREYHEIQGRWVLPDPAGLAAVDPTNPQSWNRYAYVVGNPLGLIDPLGLYHTVPDNSDPNDPADLIVGDYNGDKLCDVNGICLLWNAKTGTWENAPEQSEDESDSDTSFSSGIVPPGPQTPANNVTNIIHSLQRCGAAGNAAAGSAGNDLAQMQASGHIQILPNMPQNAAGNTTVPPGAPFGLQVPTIQVGADVTAGTLFHEWIHKTQVYGNPLGTMAVSVNKALAFFNKQGEGPLDSQADRITDRILTGCGISQ